MSITLDHLRRFTVARSLFTPTTLKAALNRLGFVQADPIRAPARAQDLILRHRVKDYRAGDLERDYAKLGVEEDFFITYGFVTPALQTLMHPRAKPGTAVYGLQAWPAARRKKAQLLLDFVGERGAVHPREVNERFAHGKVTNHWGGKSNATTFLLDAMHYRGLLRVARREGGIRIYATHQHGPEPADTIERHLRIDALVDAAVGIYAPVHAASLGYLVRRLRYAAPQWQGELKGALQRAKQRLAHAKVDEVDWYWPTDEDPKGSASQDEVRLLTPFDPLVWDRARLELLWGWAYRFEAYTPIHKRKLGYYALPMLWRDQVIGWANISVKEGGLISELGYIKSQPRDRLFKKKLESELDRMREFLGLKT